MRTQAGSGALVRSLVVAAAHAASFAACGGPPRPDAGADASADVPVFVDGVSDASPPLDARDEPSAADALEETPVSDVTAAPDARDEGSDSELPPVPGCAIVDERCDGRDNNCDGRVDEGCRCEPGATQPCYAGDPRQAGVGVCTYGAQTCTSARTWGACTGWGTPRSPTCTGVDDRCNGRIDEGCDCGLGDERACYSGPERTAGVGLCRAGIQRQCGLRGQPRQWGACVGQVLPEPNRCDGVDRACRGEPRLGCACIVGERRACYSGPAATRGVGVCRDGEQQCALDASGVAAWTRCEGEVLPSAAYDVRCDGLDHGCRGEAPLACRCLLGQSRSCYSGPEGTEGRGVCRAGTQRCVIGSGGRAEFGPCEGEVGPAAGDACDNGRDDDCDGDTDEGCSCDGPVACYTGPSSTRRRGSCRDGAYSCVTDASGRRSLDTSACVGQVLPRPPAACVPVGCRNADDNCDGLPDCTLDCFRSGWQVFRTPAPVCYGITYAACGTRNEFTFAPPIPDEEALGWEPALDRQINFGTSPSSRDRRSRLAGGACTCRNGGDFTFFQTTFTVGENPLRPGFADASAFSIDIARFNNAVRATLFNARRPFGVDFIAFDAPSSACDAAPLGPMSSRVDPAIMADQLAPGVNRLVLTLLDDCAGERELTGVDLHIDGRLVDACEPDPTDPSCRE